MRETETPKPESPRGQAEAARAQGGEGAIWAEVAQSRAAELTVAEQKTSASAIAEGTGHGIEKALDRL